MLNLNKKYKYLLACSFGPDSMALFDMLLKENINFEVAHVNYHLREESNVEEKSLREYCLHQNIQIHVLDVKEKIVKNIEAKCRNIRYEFFNQLCVKYGFNGLLVAHNEDDLLETYIMQKRRQNLVKHYGIAEKSNLKDMVLYRPLLSFTKESLLNYCQDNGIPYSIDKTNLERTFLRNRVRMDVVSKMTREERSRILLEVDAKNKEVDNILSNISQIGSDIPSILRLNDIELAYYLYNLINKDEHIYDITYQQCQEVRKMLVSSNPNIALSIKNNEYLLVKEYKNLFFRKNANPNGYDYVIEEPKLIDDEFIYLDLLSDTSNRNITKDDYPLRIRTSKSGDKYQIKDYMVPVRRLFIDWKMPMSIRKRWPLILNKEGKIVYIPRYKKDFVPEPGSNFYVKECFTLK